MTAAYWSFGHLVLAEIIHSPAGFAFRAERAGHPGVMRMLGEGEVLAGAAKLEAQVGEPVSSASIATGRNTIPPPQGSGRRRSPSSACGFHSSPARAPVPRQGRPAPARAAGRRSDAQIAWRMPSAGSTAVARRAAAEAASSAVSSVAAPATAWCPGSSRQTSPPRPEAATQPAVQLVSGRCV